MNDFDHDCQKLFGYINSIVESNPHPIILQILHDYLNILKSPDGFENAVAYLSCIIDIIKDFKQQLASNSNN